jgi:hypothetical protein
MGSSGGHTKKTAITGTQKKTIREGYKMLRKGEPYREKAMDKFSKMLDENGLKYIKRYISESKDPYKDIQKMFGPKGTAYEKPDYAKDLQKGQKIAEGVMAPERAKAMQAFEQQGVPQIYETFGRGTRGSSALNQALTQARTSLEGDLYNRSQQLGLDIGQNIAGMNSTERARQQGLQYGALSDILGQQRGAASELYGQRQNAASQLFSAGIPGAQINLAKDQYAFAPKSTPFIQSLALAGIEAAGNSAGKSAGGAGKAG